MASRSSPSPNVLFILTDDQRFDTIHALGNPNIHTPNLDKMANHGFAFSRNFCTTPICTPARAEILTGCTSFANHVPWFGMPINPELTLLPKAMSANGYHTIHVGKWHNDGHPRDRGYASTHCVFPGDNLASGNEGHYVRFTEAGEDVAGHSTEVFTDAALTAISDAPSSTPWFCYLAFTAPHDPHESPDSFSCLYDHHRMPLLPNFMPEHPFDNGDMVIRDELLENWPRTHSAMQRYRARYYAMISHLDHHVGRLLGRLRAVGQIDNTVVIFTGDQGLAIGSHGLLGKENMYDHSIASPLIYCGPGIPPGGRSSALAHHVDHFPTICELCGVNRPDTARDGHSLVPLFSGKEKRVRDEVLCEFYSPEEPGQQLRNSQRAIRTERWKLTWYPLIGRYQLFDMSNDPHELVDLLAEWRRRRRLSLESGSVVWTKDAWAARDPRPSYTQAHIAAVTSDMHARMLSQMKIHGDPLLAESPPPAPPGIAQ